MEINYVDHYHLGIATNPWFMRLLTMQQLSYSLLHSLWVSPNTFFTGTLITHKGKSLHPEFQTVNVTHTSLYLGKCSINCQTEAIIW